MLAAIVQARMGANRLPGKVLLPMPMENAHGATVLSQVYARLKQVAGLDEIVIAIPTSPLDDPLAEWLKNRGINMFRGDEHDVLSRYYHAAKAYGADNVMRVTADCPCIDSAVLGDLIAAYKGLDADYLSNTQPRSYPHGLDAEIFSFAALERAYHEAKAPYEREHVTPYLYRSGKFSCKSYINPHYQAGEESIRITLDSQQDYIAIAALYDLLGENFAHKEILATFDKYKWLKQINADIVQKTFYESEAEELRGAINLLKRQDMARAAALLQQATEKF
ncbi:MAG: glycosyltransferase family protein [Deferribacteraceae bacterium]|jgi:spore coat polysaccharide biosynthesis protein SpsF|nr:glycosyltransferase family protein [Deferribacteraceae bacterium]